MIDPQKTSIGVMVNYLRRHEVGVECVALLIILGGGVGSYPELRRFFPEDEVWLRKRVLVMRKAGLIKPWRGHRDFSLELSDYGHELLRRVVHGIRAIVSPRVE